MRKQLPRIAVGLAFVTFFLLHAAGLVPSRFIRQLELWSYDQRLNLTLSTTQDTRIVIVDIDEKSLAEVGRWPWSRNQIAHLLDQLFDRYQVAVVGFDVVFAEPDTSSGLQVLDRFSKKELRDDVAFQQAVNRLRRQLDYDALFAARMKGRPVVLGYYFSSAADRQGQHTAGSLPPPVLTMQNLSEGVVFLEPMAGYGANLPILQQHAALAGHFNPVTDMDGVARRVPMLMRYGDACYESLSLAVVRTLLGIPPLSPGFPGKGEMLEWLQVVDLKIPVDAHATALIPYRGRQGSFPYFSAVDLLKGRVAREQLEGAIVLVGTTAPGLMDLRSTPVSAVYPGVEIHANMIAGILDQRIKHAPSYARGAELVTVALTGGLLTFLLPVLGPVASLGLTAGLALGVTVGNLVAWHHHLVLPLASSLLLILLLYLWNATYGFVTEARTKRQITGLFGQYVPPQIVKVMSRDPERFTMEAESRDMTVLFCDVVGFTSISEQLEPRVLAQVMNDYLSAMTAVIYQYGGTVDKYIGDAIMAFWGAPLPDADHARHAVQAALAMQKRMEHVREDFSARGLPALSIGIGINSGQMRVGNMGSSYRMAYTVMGDAVNLASRLEGLTRQYGMGIIVGEETVKRVQDYYFQQLDLVRVKGKQTPVMIAEPWGPIEELGLQGAERSQVMAQFWAAYCSRDWDRAEELLAQLARYEGMQQYGALFRERLAQLRVTPPSDAWDGVCTFTEK